MCADKTKDKTGNGSASSEPETAAGDTVSTTGVKAQSSATSSLRKLFSSAEPGDKAVALTQTGETAQTPPAMQAQPPDPNETAPRLPAMSKPFPADLPVAQIASERKTQVRTRMPTAVKAIQSDKYGPRSVSRSFGAGLGQTRLKPVQEPLVLAKLLDALRSRRDSSLRKVTAGKVADGLKQVKNHPFLRKESMQEFAYRINEVTKDWEDFRFVEPADDVEWHRSSLNQALNDFASGLALPSPTLALEEKIEPGLEPQYLVGKGMIVVKSDDIRNANNVDIGGLYHELMHCEQDAAIVRRIALISTLLKSGPPETEEVLSEYCRQTGLEPEQASSAWIETVLQSSSDWLSRKSDEIKRYQKKNQSATIDEAFARDRDLSRAKALTESLCEQFTMHKHMTRKNGLLVYMHQEFTRNFEPHVYAKKLVSSTSFQRMVFGYEWNREEQLKDDEFCRLLSDNPELIQTVLFAEPAEWQKSLLAHYQATSGEKLARLKIAALCKAFELEVGHQAEPHLIHKFDNRYRQATRTLLRNIEDGVAEEIKQKSRRHYLGVDLELEANHAGHLIGKLYGQDLSATISSDRAEESSGELFGALSELNDQLADRSEQLPQLPLEDSDQAAVVVRHRFEPAAPELLLTRNSRVNYRGEAWTIADFHPDTGDAILHRSEERKVESGDVFLGERPLVINETYKVINADGRLEDGWIFRGRDEDKLLMFKANAQVLQVPQVALLSVNKLLANARAASSTTSLNKLPRIAVPPPIAALKESIGKSKSGLSLAGSQLDSYMIEELISDRHFYWIYSGRDQSTFERKVFKVAKPFEYLKPIESIDPLKSVVLKISSVGFIPTTPDTAELLKLQCERMSHDTDMLMARIEAVRCTDALCYSRMEFLEGATLRQLREHGPLSLELALDIVDALDRIQKNEAMHYHGDLTPDNIMISYSTVKLLDAGYFGALQCTEGTVEDAAITTPAYYPFLTPNDMLALGIIFWEMHFGKNPFASFEESPAPAAGISQALVRVLKGYSSIGRPFVNSMARLPLPRMLEPSIHPELEKFLLAALGLRIDQNGALDPAPRFESFEQMTCALRLLETYGINEL